MSGLCMLGQHSDSVDLLARLRVGDERAAEELFGRYVNRLTLLARARLSPRLSARTDPEDVVLSAWRSFFVGARDGRFSFQRSGDLWRLLVSITLHKLYHHVRRHSAEVRNFRREQSIGQESEEWLACIAREPTPDEAAALTNQLETVFAQLSSFERRVFELRLQDYPLADIAEETGRSERTVRRTLARIREAMKARRKLDGDE